MSEAPLNLPPEYAIKVRSYQVFDNALTGTAVHNEIIFEHKGEALLSFNGNPWDRETGKLNNPGISENNTLRVNTFEGKTIKDLDKDGKYPVVGEQTLYQSSDPAKFMELLGRATEASKFINSQNLDYIIVDPFRVAQNSNSVAHTLTQAMGLEYPPETENLWAPGHGRVLLPEGYRSVFNDIKGNSDWLNDPVLSRYYETTLKELEKLNPESVSQQVLKDSRTPNAASVDGELSYRNKPLNIPTYFNPQNPVSYPNFYEPDKTTGALPKTPEPSAVTP